MQWFCHFAAEVSIHSNSLLRPVADRRRPPIQLGACCEQLCITTSRASRSYLFTVHDIVQHRGSGVNCHSCVKHCEYSRTETRTEHNTSYRLWWFRRYQSSERQTVSPRQCLTFEELVHSRHDDDGDGQQLAEGEDDLDPRCPCHTHAVQIHNSSYGKRERDSWYIASAILFWLNLAKW